MTTTTLPVVLGAVIPIVCAVVVLFILHRRHLRRLRQEDANDKHKSLDFGMEIVEPGMAGRRGRNNNAGVEMSMANTEKSDRKGGRGLSLDMVNSPYLLPPGLHGSRESLTSLSRSISAGGEDDNYRHAMSYMTNDNSDARSYAKYGPDDASTADDMRQNLLHNAQRMSRTSPPLQRASLAEGDFGRNPHAKATRAENGLPRAPSPAVLPPPTAAGREQRASAASSVSMNGTDFRRSNDYLGQAVTTRDSVLSGPGSPTRDQERSPFDDPPSVISESTIPSQAPQLPRISLPFNDGGSDYGDIRKSESTVPAVNVLSADDDKDQDKKQNENPTGPPKTPPEPSRNDARRDTRRLTFGLRPLPPEDPSENPEERAARIRSFYKEYFDENKQGGQEEYWEDFGPEFYGDGAVYDPATGDYIAGPSRPFAEPVGRRAMTPPPRAPPRFQGAARHAPTNSAGGLGGLRPPEAPRALSSASGRPPAAPAPRKPIPPPEPLHVLPTPHMLKDDISILATDYAPGKNYKDQREGRADTPSGGLRPYSPAVRAHIPLASSFDDLAVMPSPHALRKSGTFTALDFAPPARFKNVESGSDAGSIRSNRTGVSAIHLHNIRAGAYRISRLPADTVGTKEDITSSLHPKWDMNR
ncbi:hypothetical protein VTN02DRAFT_5809 [Thermoascus thermophilus]